MAVDDEQPREMTDLSEGRLVPTPAGDHVLTAEVYATYRLPLLRFVRNLARESNLSEAQLDTEGIVQDVFTAAVMQWSTIEHPPAWLYTVARRLVGRAARRAHQTIATDTGDLEQATGRGWSSLPIQTELQDIIAAREITDAIARLPGNQSVATYLARVQNWSTREIADLLDCAQSTAGVHIYRGTHEVRLLLGERRAGVLIGDANRQHNGFQPRLVRWLLVLLGAALALAIHASAPRIVIIGVLVALTALILGGVVRWWTSTRL